MKLKKGSAAAKAYMAKIRAKRKKVKKSTIAKPKRAARKVVKAARKKAAKKVTSMHKDTASHNVRISVISGVSSEQTLRQIKSWENIILELRKELKSKNTSAANKTIIKKDIALSKSFLNQKKRVLAAQMRKIK